MPEPRPKTLLQELSNALLGEGGVVLVVDQNGKQRAELLEDLPTLVPSNVTVLFVDAVDEALSRVDAVCVVVTDDEVGTLRILEGRRTALERRQRPLVLFLTEGGDGLAWLANEGVGVASFVRSSVVDNRVDVVDLEALRWLLLLALPEEQRRRLEPAPWDEAPADVKSLMGIPLR